MCGSRIPGFPSGGRCQNARGEEEITEMAVVAAADTNCGKAGNVLARSLAAEETCTSLPPSIVPSSLPPSPAIASGPREGGLERPRDQLFPSGGGGLNEIGRRRRRGGRRGGVIWGYVLASVPCSGVRHTAAFISDSFSRSIFEGKSCTFIRLDVKFRKKISLTYDVEKAVVAASVVLRAVHQSGRGRLLFC